MNGSSGVANTVLTTNGTTATWAAPAWVGTATGPLNMGSYNISTALLDSSTSLRIGTSTATSIIMGKSGVNVNVSNLNVSIGTIRTLNASTINADDLIMVGSTNITLGNGTVTPTVGQLGYVYSATWIPAAPPASNLANNTVNTYGSLVDVPPGVYMVTGNLKINQTTAAPIQVFSIWIGSSTTNYFENRHTGIASTAGLQMFRSITGVVVLTATTTLSLYSFHTAGAAWVAYPVRVTSGTQSNFALQAVRIA
jgi:hypothetical protein